MYKPHKPYVPTALEVVQQKNAKATTKGAYMSEAKETIKHGGGHYVRDKQWANRANPDYATVTKAHEARKDHFMKQRRLQKIV
jgi:hypothetical protein